MPLGTPEGLLSSLSHIGFIRLKTNPLFHKAGWQLSFLLLLEVFFGFGQTRCRYGCGSGSCRTQRLAAAVPGLCPCVCWRMLHLHGDSEAAAASLSGGKRPGSPPLVRHALLARRGDGKPWLYAPWGTVTLLLAQSSCLQHFHHPKKLLA